jgi:hypothetical protein
VDEDARKDIREEFNEAVNMSPSELEDWLETDESKNVGWVREGEDESVGRQSAKRIIEIKRRTKDELTEDDYAHMRKVIGYVHRHMAQPPQGDPTETRWRYSLMNWGHDPLKDRAG